MSRRQAFFSTNLDPRVDVALGVGAVLALLAVVAGIGFFMWTGIVAVWTFFVGLPAGFYFALEAVVSLWYVQALLRGKLGLLGLIIAAVFLYLLVTNPIATTVLFPGVLALAGR